MDKTELLRVADEDANTLIPNLITTIHEMLGPVVAERNYAEMAEMLAGMGAGLAMMSNTYRVLDMVLKSE